MISLIHFHNKNLGLAEDAVNKALGIQPNSITFRKLAATIHLSLSDYEKAMEEKRRKTKRITFHERELFILFII